MPKINTETPLGVKALAYLNIKDKIKTLQSEEKGYRSDLEQHLQDNFSLDTKGHKIAIVSHAGQDVELKHERRVSTIEKPDAISILKKILPDKYLNQVVEKVEVIRQDVIEVLFNDGVITSEQMEQLYEPKETYAFKVKKV